MKHICRSLLVLGSVLWAGTAMAGPSFNTDAPANLPSSERQASGPSFGTDAAPSFDPGQGAALENPAAPQAPQEFVESRDESRWLTTSIDPMGKSYVKDEASQTENIELEFRYAFTNRSEDRVFSGLKDVSLTLSCTVETFKGKAEVEIRYTSPMRKLKKQRGPGEYAIVVYKLKADESCVLSKDEGVTWKDIANKLPSDWWGYRIKHQYSVISQKY